MGGSGPRGTIPVCSTMRSFSNLLGCHLTSTSWTVPTDVHTTHSPPNTLWPQQVTQHRAEGQTLPPHPPPARVPMLLSPVCTPQPHTRCATRWHNALVSVSGLELGSPLLAWAVCTSDHCLLLSQTRDLQKYKSTMLLFLLISLLCFGKYSYIFHINWSLCYIGNGFNTFK